MKRLVDFLLSLFLLIIISPFLMSIALVLLFTMGYPVIFIQRRVGKGEQVIRLLKFRSMTNETDEEGRLLPNSERITKVGRFIRSTSIDELPSLVNVLKGDLSIVGPRPLLVRYLPFYKSRHRKRHAVRPGITGLAQVSGRNNITWNKRLDLDVYYVENNNLILDLKILCLTVRKVLARDGVEGNDDLSITPLDKDKSYNE